jgi:hypothetical protein
MSDRLTKLTDEQLFDEWRAIFTRYREYGENAPADIRVPFRELSAEMRRRGLITAPKKEPVA